MTPGYFDRYENLAMERTESGILTVRLHTAGGPVVFTGQTHHDLPRAFAEQLAEKPQLLLRYTTLVLRQRLLRRLNEGTQLGMALEGLTAADLAYQAQAPARAASERE